MAGENLGTLSVSFQAETQQFIQALNAAFARIKALQDELGRLGRGLSNLGTAGTGTGVQQIATGFRDSQQAAVALNRTLNNTAKIAPQVATALNSIASASVNLTQTVRASNTALQVQLSHLRNFVQHTQGVAQVLAGMAQAQQRAARAGQQNTAAVQQQTGAYRTNRAVLKGTGPGGGAGGGTFLGNLAEDMGRVIRLQARFLIGFQAIAAVMATFKAGASAAIEFNKRLAEIAAVAGASKAQLQQLSAAALDIGRSTTVPATEAAGALVLLSQAGFTANEATDALRATVALSVGGFASMEESVQLITTTLRAFRLDASDADRVANVLAATVNQSKTNIEGLNVALAYVANAADAAGVSLEETNALIGTLADNGLRASTQGTALRQLLTQLAAPTKKAAEVFKGLGLSVAELNPVTNNIVDVLKRLREAGFGAQEAAEAFGARSSNAIITLVRNAEHLEGLIGRITNTNAAFEAQQKAMDSVAGRAAILANQFQVLAITAGETLAPAFKTLLDVMTAALKVVEEWGTLIGTLALLGVAQGVLAVARAFGVLAAAATLARNAIIGLAVLNQIALALGPVAALSAAFSELGLVIAALFTPLNIFLAVLTALGVAYFKITAAQQKLTQELESNAEAVRRQVQSGRALVANYEGAVIAADKAKEGTRQYATAQADLRRASIQLALAFPQLGGAIDKTTGKIVGDTATIKNAIRDNITAAIDELVDKLSTLEASLVNPFNAFYDWLTGNSGKLREELDRLRRSREEFDAAGPPLSQSEAQGARTVVGGLVKRGFTPVQAAGVAGNIKAESGYSPTAVNPVSGALGLMQWLGDRKQGLINYARFRGRNPNDMEIQLDYIDLERTGRDAQFTPKKTTEQASYARALGGGTPEQIAADFGRFVERPSEKELAGSMAARQQAARGAFNAFEGLATQVEGLKADFENRDDAAVVARVTKAFDQLKAAVVGSLSGDEAKKATEELDKFFQSSEKSVAGLTAAFKALGPKVVAALADPDAARKLQTYLTLNEEVDKLGAAHVALNKEGDELEESAEKRLRRAEFRAKRAEAAQKAVAASAGLSPDQIRKNEADAKALADLESRLEDDVLTFQEKLTDIIPDVTVNLTEVMTTFREGTLSEYEKTLLGMEGLTKAQQERITKLVSNYTILRNATVRDFDADAANAETAQRRSQLSEDARERERAENEKKRKAEAARRSLAQAEANWNQEQLQAVGKFVDAVIAKYDALRAAQAKGIEAGGKSLAELDLEEATEILQAVEKVNQSRVSGEQRLRNERRTTAEQSFIDEERQLDLEQKQAEAGKGSLGRAQALQSIETRRNELAIRRNDAMIAFEEGEIALAKELLNIDEARRTLAVERVRAAAAALHGTQQQRDAALEVIEAESKFLSVTPEQQAAAREAVAQGEAKVANLKSQNNELKQSTDLIEKAGEATINLGSLLQSTIGEAFEGIILGTSKLEDVFKNAGVSLLKSITGALSQSLIEKLGFDKDFKANFLQLGADAGAAILGGITGGLGEGEGEVGGFVSTVKGLFSGLGGGGGATGPAQVLPEGVFGPPAPATTSTGAGAAGVGGSFAGWMAALTAVIGSVISIINTVKGLNQTFKKFEKDTMGDPRANAAFKGFSTAGMVIGTAGGAAAGAAGGAAIGSIVPGIGTAIGAIVGAAVGAALGAALSKAVADSIGRSVGKGTSEAIKQGLSQEQLDEKVVKDTGKDLILNILTAGLNQVLISKYLAPLFTPDIEDIFDKIFVQVAEQGNVILDRRLTVAGKGIGKANAELVKSYKAYGGQLKNLMSIVAGVIGAGTDNAERIQRFIAILENNFAKVGKTAEEVVQAAQAIVRAAFDGNFTQAVRILQTLYQVRPSEGSLKFTQRFTKQLNELADAFQNVVGKSLNLREFGKLLVEGEFAVKGRSLRESRKTVIEAAPTLFEGPDFEQNFQSFVRKLTDAVREAFIKGMIQAFVTPIIGSVMRPLIREMNKFINRTAKQNADEAAELTREKFNKLIQEAARKTRVLLEAAKPYLEELFELLKDFDEEIGREEQTAVERVTAQAQALQSIITSIQQLVISIGKGAAQILIDADRLASKIYQVSNTFLRITKEGVSLDLPSIDPAQVGRLKQIFEEQQAFYEANKDALSPEQRLQLAADLETAADNYYQAALDLAQSRVREFHELKAAINNLLVASAQIMVDLVNMTNRLLGKIDAVLHSVFEIKDGSVQLVNPPTQQSTLDRLLGLASQLTTFYKANLDDLTGEGRLAILGNIEASVDEFFQLTVEAIQNQFAPLIEIAFSFQQIAESTKDLITQITRGPESITPGRERLAGVRRDVATELATFRAGSPEDQVKSAQKLQELLQEQLSVARETLDTTGPEFQAIFLEVISVLSEIEHASQDRAAELNSLVEQMNEKLKEAGEEAAEYYQYVKEQTEAALLARQTELTEEIARDQAALNKLGNLATLEAQSLSAFNEAKQNAINFYAYVKQQQYEAGIYAQIERIQRWRQIQNLIIGSGGKYSSLADVLEKVRGLPPEQLTQLSEDIGLILSVPIELLGEAVNAIRGRAGEGGGGGEEPGPNELPKRTAAGPGLRQRARAVVGQGTLTAAQTRQGMITAIGNTFNSTAQDLVTSKTGFVGTMSLAHKIIREGLIAAIGSLELPEKLDFVDIARVAAFIRIKLKEIQDVSGSQAFRPFQGLDGAINKIFNQYFKALPRAAKGLVSRGGTQLIQLDGPELNLPLNEQGTSFLVDAITRILGNSTSLAGQMAAGVQMARMGGGDAATAKAGTSTSTTVLQIAEGAIQITADGASPAAAQQISKATLQAIGREIQFGQLGQIVKKRAAA